MNQRKFDIHELLKARLQIVRADLLEVMHRITDEDLNWAPQEGMRTIGGLLKEILGTEKQDLDILKGKELRSFKEYESECDFSTVEEFRLELEKLGDRCWNLLRINL